MTDERYAQTMETYAARTEGALDTLLAEETRLETIRTTGEATYSLQRHVAVLTALLAEVRLVPAI